jgi:hypothetical protein
MKPRGGQNMEIDEFCKILQASVAKSGKEGIRVRLRPNLSVFINKDFVEKNREKIIEGIKRLNQALKNWGEASGRPELSLENGLSYINIAGCPGYHLEQTEALILLAVGKVLGIWDIFPDPEDKSMHFVYQTAGGIFPMNRGYRIKEE